jgi:hypothetical protein
MDMEASKEDDVARKLDFPSSSQSQSQSQGILLTRLTSRRSLQPIRHTHIRAHAHAGGLPRSERKARAHARKNDRTDVLSRGCARTYTRAFSDSKELHGRPLNLDL